jgi:VWFA-related protein
MRYLPRISRRWFFGFLLLPAMCLFAAELSPIPSAQETQKSGEQSFSLEVNVDLVVLNATVVDERGAYVEGLGKDDFVLYEDGERQDLSVLLPMEAPFQLVMLIDNSSSTKANLGIIKKAAINFTDELRPADRISVYEINFFVRPLSDFTSDRRVLRKHIDKLTTFPYGGSKVYDGIAEGIQKLKNVSGGRKALVLLSDNMENFSEIKFEELRRLIAENDAVLYSVTILNKEGQKEKLESYLKSPKAEEPFISNARNSLSVLEEVYEIQNERMSALTEESGGRMMLVKDLIDLRGEYTKVANELRHTYTLAYYSKNHWHDGTVRKLKVELKNPRYQVRTRTSYYVPKE